MDTDRLWKAALGQLELRVSQGNFLTWFRQTRIREKKDSTIIIETNSPFAYEWLSKKYQGVILEVLQALDHTVTQVKFHIGSASPHQRLLKKSSRILAQKTRVATVDAAPNLPAPAAHTPTTPRHPISRTLNPHYIFNTFITGPSNEIAYAACQAVAAKSGTAYNPLFIYGGVGLGKTHLLQAVGNAILGEDSMKKVLYVSSEKFINEFVEAIRNRTTQQFRKNYRMIDVLIIDDVQFLAGKEKTQEELFHTFNTLHSQNKQVILSSDRPPSAIPTLQERLSSRLTGGMIVDIKKPDYETRLAILEEKARGKGADINQEVLSYIAKNIQNNVRELEGALNRVVAHSQVQNQVATLDYTKKILGDMVNSSQPRTVDVKRIIDAVSMFYNLPTTDLQGKRRQKEIVRPRQIAMYLLRKENNMSFPSIGEHFGGRDHTTAMHACDKIEKLLEHDDELIQEINLLKERLYA